MFLTQFRVLKSHGKQYIKDLSKVTLPEIYRGRPEFKGAMSLETIREITAACPTGAFSASPFSIDTGKCCFCGECERLSSGGVKFTNDYRMASNIRENLVVTPESGSEIKFEPEQVRQEVFRYFGRALKLRQVSAGGDNSTEMELNASMNVNFDFGRYGIDFVASPRHADGIVITGPVTANMAEALDICYQSIAQPKLIILAGCEAISGGIFAGSPALDRSFLECHKPDLYLPGDPVHPMTFIDGVLTLLKRGRRK